MSISDYDTFYCAVFCKLLLGLSFLFKAQTSSSATHFLALMYFIRLTWQTKFHTRTKIGSFIVVYFNHYGFMCGSSVVKVLCYKSEDRWFDPSWCHWNFSLT